MTTRRVSFTLFIGIAMALPSCGPEEQGLLPGLPLPAATEDEYMDDGQTVASQLEGLPPISLDELATLAEQIAPLTATASPEDARATLISALWDDAAKRKRDADIQKSPSLYNLTNAEILLLVTNPTRIAPTRRTRDDTMAAEAARFGSNGLDNKGDAFRHSYWNVLMCARISKAWAEKFSTAHESENDPQDLSTQMDLNNNAVGRKVWDNNKKLSESKLADKLMKYGFKRVSKGSQMSTAYLVYLKD